MKCITSNLLIKFSNGNGILLPKIIKLWQCNALLNNVICLKTATGYSKLQKPLKFLQSRMIDGPDVEFLLREKDFMIKAIENDLREDFFLFQPFSKDDTSSSRKL